MHQLRQNIPFLIAIMRGIYAVALGIILLFNPNKSQAFLGNFMAGFWISVGLLLLRKDSDEAFEAVGKRSSLIFGVIAIASGLLVITRRITRQWVDPALQVQILGLVILLTGVLHIVGVVRLRRVRKGGRTWAHIALGIFEIVLGSMLFISPLAYGPPVYWTAVIWALVGGGMIIGTAVFDHFKSSK
jgi:uncharacterized membrane protein HdeD (DUF308 family)